MDVIKQTALAICLNTAIVSLIALFAEKKLRESALKTVIALYALLAVAAPLAQNIDNIELELPAYSQQTAADTDTAAAYAGAVAAEIQNLLAERGITADVSAQMVFNSSGQLQLDSLSVATAAENEAAVRETVMGCCGIEPTFSEGGL